MVKIPFRHCPSLLYEGHQTKHRIQMPWASDPPYNNSRAWYYRCFYAQGFIIHYYTTFGFYTMPWRPATFHLAQVWCVSQGILLTKYWCIIKLNYLEVSEPKWVNSEYVSNGVISLRLGGLHINLLYKYHWTLHLQN